MTLKESLIMVVISLSIGLTLGLIIRIKRENVSTKDYGAMIILLVKFLIIYPFILFPFIAHFTKDVIADNLATQIQKRNNGCNKKSKKEIETEILENFNIRFIFTFWGLILNDMIRDYDGYVDENIILARKIIKEKKSNKNEVIKRIRNTRYSNFKTYQKEVIKNAKVNDMDMVYC